MLDGMKIASQGMLALMTQQNVTSNNLANVNTVGFQSTTAVTHSFDAALQGQMKSQGYEAVGGDSQGVPVVGIKTMTKFDHGAMKSTGNFTDLALSGDKCNFFTMQGPKGETMYTRNGNFSISPQGYLVNSEGSKVLGFNGPIQIPAGKQFAVDDKGIVSVDGKELSRLRVTEFKDMNEVYNIGGNCFKTKSPTNIGQISSDPKVQQNFLETSNVSVIKEMIKMMDIEKAYESNQKVLQAEDQMLQKSVTEVGRVG